MTDYPHCPLVVEDAISTVNEVAALVGAQRVTELEAYLAETPPPNTNQKF